METKFRQVVQMVLDKLEAFLESQETVDPQKCKHITGALKDIRELRAEDAGPKELVVRFDAPAEEAAN